jgi:hypothetical protein
MKHWIIVICCVYLSLLSTTGFALPLNPGFSAPDIESLPLNEMVADEFDGIIALSNCSGSLVKFAQSEETDAAMVLTNGHCLESGFPHYGEVVVDRPVSREIRILNPSTGKTIGRVRATKVLYATMTKTDMTLYLLDKTYREIEDTFGVKPFLLSERAGEVGQKIKIVSGYWRRSFSCEIEAIVHSLREFEWTFNESIRYSRPGCEVIPGTSGSPVIADDTREIIGINNTINENGEKCTLNNPCEVDKDGNIFYQKGYGYGQQIRWIYSCLDESRKINLSKKGCELPIYSTFQNFFWALSLDPMMAS